MVNKAIEDMVCLHHGEEVWDRIKVRAGVDVDLFISNEGYADSITYDLVTAAAAELNTPAKDILHAFGEHWVLRTAREGYGSMLDAGGKNLRDFLINLPNFHTHVTLVFRDLQPPRFACSEVTKNSLLLHYHTHRPGLSAFVVGLLHGLGKMFATPVEVEQVAFKQEGADHDIFRVVWP